MLRCALATWGGGAVVACVDAVTDRRRDCGELMWGLWSFRRASRDASLWPGCETPDVMAQESGEVQMF